MKNRKVIVPETGKVAFVTGEMQMPVLAPGSALIRNHYTLISTGTELACVNGYESSWFNPPAVLGYTSVGEIVALADDVTSFQVGDVVYHFGGHQEYQVMPVSGCFMKVPEGIEEKYVPLVRMATIAAGAIRTSDLEIGDFMAVTGQGMIGIMVAQLAHMQGAYSIGIDRHPSRLNVAKLCHADYVINPKEADVLTEIRKITNGQMLDTFVEAIGNTQISAQAVDYMARNGEIILLGTPRTKYEADLAPVFFRIFNSDYNIRFKGAHEWKDANEPDKFVKHSIVRNTEIMFRMMQDGRLVYKPLLTHTVKPEDCAEVYRELAVNKEDYLGVVFDWMH